MKNYIKQLFVIAIFLLFVSNAFADYTGPGKIKDLAFGSGGVSVTLDVNGATKDAFPDQGCGHHYEATLNLEHDNYNAIVASLLSNKLTGDLVRIWVEGCSEFRTNTAKIIAVRDGEYPFTHYPQ